MKWLPDDIDLTDYMQSQEMRQKVRPASDFRADVLQRLKSDPSLTGERLPWKKTEKLIRFRAGELTLWTGINGHGKSKLLGQVATGLMYQGAAVCIASLEMHPAETVKRMVEQAEGNGRRSERYGNQYLDWSDNRLWVYDHVGECKSDRMLALVRYCAAKLQIKHFFYRLADEVRRKARRLRRAIGFRFCPLRHLPRYGDSHPSGGALQKADGRVAPAGEDGR